MDLDCRRFIDAKHLVTVEVCLLNTSVLKRNLAIECGRDTKDCRALNLRLDRIGIDRGAAVDSTDNAPDTNIASRRTNDVGCSLRSFSWEFPSTGRHPTWERHNPSRRTYNSTVTAIVRVAN